MALRFPKSIGESKPILAWLFPAQLGYAVISMPGATYYSQIGLFLAILIVLTGWQSFGIIEEILYNDVLLTIDLFLFASYWFLMFSFAHVATGAPSDDMPIYIISGVIFLLYASWNIAALAGRDTRAFATTAHLARFAKITLVVAFIFFAIGYLTNLSQTPGLDVHLICRPIGALLWVGILAWWQVGKFIAAANDLSEV